MRNAKDSALNTYAVKNGCNRDGNEKVRKGLGCTNRSWRMDWFPGAGIGYGADGNPKRHPTANKIARQCPLFPLFEDGQNEQAITVIENALLDRAYGIGITTANDVADYEADRAEQDFRDLRDEYIGAINADHYEHTICDCGDPGCHIYAQSIIFTALP